MDTNKKKNDSNRWFKDMWVMYSPIIFFTLQSKLRFCSLAANDNKADGCPPRLELQQLLVLDNLTWSHGRHLLQSLLLSSRSTSLLLFQRMLAA